MDVIKIDEQLRQKGVEIEVVAYITETLPDGRSITADTKKLTISELVGAMERMNY